MAQEVDLRLLRGSSLSQFLGNEEGFAAIVGARWCQGSNSRVCEGSTPRIHCQPSSTHTPGGSWRSMLRLPTLIHRRPERCFLLPLFIQRRGETV